jgi:hypothetical protein
METVTASEHSAEGVAIETGYRFGACIAATERQLIYETIYRAGSAVIRIFLCQTPAEASELVRGFALASQLPHPGLLAVYDYGQCDGGPSGLCAWVVGERADECLADVLRERTLSEEEVRELLYGLLPPLEFLRDRGLAPLNLNPAFVFARGNQIKLGPDRIGSPDAQADQSALSKLILEALTGSIDEEAVPRLNSPFREIVLGRWDSARVRSALSGEVVSEPEESSAPVSDRERTSRQPKYKKVAGLAIGGALASAVLCGLLIRGAHHSSEQSFEPQTIHVVPVPLAGGTNPKSGDKSYPAVRHGWALVAAAYNSSNEAARRAGAIDKEHPKLDAQVYSTGDSTNPYVVLLGSGMTEAQARRQLVRARRAGAPSGAYIGHFE